MKNRFADTGKSYAGYFLRFVFCLVLTASALSSQAQSRNQVSGKVTDTAGEPLIGATVVVVGTTTGTTTGIDGSYTINAAADSQLKFSFITDVKVLSPQSLKDTIKEKIEENLQKYLSMQNECTES